jgi:hypothetical protein
MLTWLLGAAAVATASALLVLLLRKKKKIEIPIPKPQPSGAGDEKPKDLKTPVVRKNDEVKAIAGRIKFSTGPVVTAHVKVGDRLEAVDFPADHVDIRPMQSVTSDEMRRLLPSAVAMDEDVFFGRLATHDLPVIEHQARVDVFRDVVEEPRNILVVLQDVSGSMRDFNRIDWAATLGGHLIDRALVGKAEVALLPFANVIHDWIRAQTVDELTQLKKDLARYLRADGGTDIAAALSAGFMFVSDPTFTERKLILVTDGTESVDVQSVRATLKNLRAQLYVVCIGKENDSLKAAADEYHLLRD